LPAGSVPNSRLSVSSSTELLDALDRFIPDARRATERPFLMPIEGVHTIEGRGTAATGQIEQGSIVPGTKVEVLGLGGLLETVISTFDFSQSKPNGLSAQDVAASVSWSGGRIRTRPGDAVTTAPACNSSP